MGKHILFIDPLEKLSFKKDSTLQLALTMKQANIQVHLLFEEDFYFDNTRRPVFKLYNFSGEFDGEGPYLKSFNLTESELIEVTSEDIIHMRIDPPFDRRYMRYLWMLNSLKKKGTRVVNDPEGILLFNEKLYAYEQEESLPSYVGSSITGFVDFTTQMHEQGHEDLILKPLDLYQGIGVEKISNSLDSKAQESFLAKVKEYKGPVVVQPFEKEVESGEVRSLFFKGVEIGSILKVPPKGEFLANIAQGATYDKYELSKEVFDSCKRICNELLEYHVDWVAFDILGGKISEVNITCPGLLVEVSAACKKNLATEIIELLD